jgi:sporulation protein YlmC with PRC-barrel domain
MPSSAKRRAIEGPTCSCNAFRKLNQIESTNCGSSTGGKILITRNTGWHENCTVTELAQTSSHTLFLGGLDMFLRKTSVMFGLAIVFGVCASPCFAQNTPASDVKRATTVGNVQVATSFPSSKLKGLNVKNTKGETIGSIDDLVINMQDGKIAYLAMSVGGVLGIGDKLFAVPFQAMKFNHGKDEMYFVLDASKEKLEKAPGFDKSNWPDFADPKWRSQIDQYYRSADTK